MKSGMLTLLAVLAVAAQAPAQGAAQGCGTELTSEGARIALERTLAGEYEPPADRIEGYYLVRLAFHIVRTGAGTGGIPQSQLDQAMIDLEAAYAGSNICFNVVDTDYIDSDTYYNVDNSTEFDALRAINTHANAIDCYFVNNIMGYCGISSFSWSAVQGIGYDNGCVGLASNPSTFPHEIGHYFDLLHTHEPAYGLECPDGSNCGSTGDLVCDTPADPQLGTDNVDTDCNYTGSDIIFCNGFWQWYNPDPNNIMSYSRKTCRTDFSAGQVSRAVATVTGVRWGEIGFYSPDLNHTVAAGWDDTIVPRSDAGGSQGSTPVTATLPGNVSNGTYLNNTTYNWVWGWSPGHYNRIFLDNSWIWWYSWSFQNAGTWLYYNNFGPVTVRGGRHSLHVELDYYDEICEYYEDNNINYTQWIWSPYVMAVDEALWRSTPPEKMTTEYSYPNCDGFQLNMSGWWEAVAVQPLSSTADYDVRLHNDYTGSTQGFGSYLSYSLYGSGEPDWVIINRNVAPGGTYQAGVFNYDGESGDMVVARSTSTTLNLVDGYDYGGSLAANEILNIFEVYVDATDQLYPWTFDLSSEDVGDLNLYLYDKDLDYGRRSDYIAHSVGPGMEESISYTFPAVGWYAIVVNKDSPDEIYDSYDYSLIATAAYPRLEITDGTPPEVALFVDGNPWGSTAWQDELDARGASWTAYASSQMATLNFDDFDLIVTVSPASDVSYHDNLQASMARFQEFNDCGGVLIMSTATNGETGTYLDGITNEMGYCSYANLDIPWHDLLDGVDDPAYGNSAVHTVYPSLASGWSSLAGSDCGSFYSCFAINEEKGAVLYGCPIEHTYLYYPGNLGECVGNLLNWGLHRANNTVRAEGTANGSIVAKSRTYLNTGAMTINYTNDESLGWFNRSPAAGSIVPYGSDVTTMWFLPAGLTEDIYRGTMTVNYDHPPSPETLYLVFKVRGRKPKAPMNLQVWPVDFTGGNAIVHTQWDPVTEDIYGNPIVVDRYDLYYSQDAYPDTWLYGGGTPLTEADLYFHNVGMTDRAFFFWVAVDEDGIAAASSRPDLVIPEANLDAAIDMDLIRSAEPAVQNGR